MGGRCRFWSAEEDEKTTVMVRHIPCKYTQDKLMDEVLLFSTGFDFLYLPLARTSKSQKNLGYAFINFNSGWEAQRFMADFDQYAFKLFPNSTKRAQVTWAELQGFQENVDFFNASKVSKSNSKYRPFIASV
jgi:hypothetical protein